MTFTDAAREVLRLCGRPLHYKEITEIAIEKNLLSHVGKSPEVTMGARLAATLKKGGEDDALVRVKPGVFALREWDGATIERAMSELAKAGGGSEEGEPDEAELASAALDEESLDEADVPGKPPVAPVAAAPAARPTASPALSELGLPPSRDEQLRAEMAASAATMFEEEEDDDRPILGGDDDAAAAGEGEGDDRRGGRRRRRRRRGGRNGTEAPPAGEGSQLPTFTVTPLASRPAGNDGSAPRPVVREIRGDQRTEQRTEQRMDQRPEGGRQQVVQIAPADLPVLDGLAGRDLADAVVVLLGTFDRGAGAVSLRQIVETAQRHGKLTGDTQLAQSHVAAAMRADISRRVAAGMRPRFRITGGRAALTDWLLDAELARLERDAIAALERLRDGARRAFAAKCAELPGHAFVELCLLVLERLGVSGLKPVRFPGASGVEVHFTGVVHSPGGVLPGAVGVGRGMGVAIVIRKDGRDVGRERVTELRGNVHHYDGAQIGWIFTSGQILSGAREEAMAEGAMPVAVLDAASMGKLCEDHNVAVVRATHPVAMPDIDLFEALRSS